MRLMYPLAHALLSMPHVAPTRRVALVASADSLTLGAAAALFSPAATQEERDAKLSKRLSNLPLLRTKLAPSTIEGAGTGLYATRDIAVGELVTLYPGDALALWSSKDGESSDNSEATVVFIVDNVAPDSDWAAGFRAQIPEFVNRAWEYGVRVSAVRALIGDPTNTGDSAYLAHMANDAGMCARPGTAAQAYTIASEAAANVVLESISLSGCHHAMVATKGIAAGAEIFLSYGAGYWLSRLPVKIKTYTFPDSGTYYGEVADGDIQGAGEYNDAKGNRYIGEFSDGLFDGVGTYFFSNGVAEAGRFLAGVAVGVSVGWSADRSEAYRLVAVDGGGAQRRVVSVEAAAELADGIGVPVPSPWPSS